MENKDEKTPLSLEKKGTKGRRKRRLARVQDTFVIYFSIVDKEWYKKNKDSYISRKTVDRDTLTPINPSLSRFFLNSTKSTDPSLYRILTEINKKLDFLIEALPNKEELGLSQHYEGICEDISGVGMKFRSDYPLLNGDLLNMTIPLPPIHLATLMVIGQVKRTKKIVDEITGEKVNEVAVEFLGINESDREEIIAYSFKRQREIINLQKTENS